MEVIRAGPGLQGMPCGRTATSGWKDPEDRWGVRRAPGGTDSTIGAGKGGLSASGFWGQGGRLGEESRKDAQRGWHSRRVWISGNSGCHGDGAGSQHGAMPGSRGHLLGGTCPSLPRRLTRGQHCVLCADLSRGRVLVRLHWQTPNLQTKRHSSCTLHVPSGPLELQAYSKQTD